MREPSSSNAMGPRRAPGSRSYASAGFSKKLLDAAIVILMAGVAASGIVYLVNSARVPQYRAVSRLLIAPNTQLFDARELLSGLETLGRTRTAATFEEVLNSDRVLAAAYEAAEVEQALIESYQAEAALLPDTDVIQVKVEGPSPETTAALTNEIVHQGRTYLNAMYPMYVLDVVDAATPAEEPFAPAMVRDIAVSFLAGSILAMGILFLISRVGSNEEQQA